MAVSRRLVIVGKAGRTWMRGVGWKGDATTSGSRNTLLESHMNVNLKIKKELKNANITQRPAFHANVGGFRASRNLHFAMRGAVTALRARPGTRRSTPWAVVVSP